MREVGRSSFRTNISRRGGCCGKTQTDSQNILKRIPTTGETLPAIGLGTWQSFDVSDVEDLVAAKETLHQFAGQGGIVVDSSPMYGKSEAVIGQLATQLGLAGKLFLATKVWTTGRAAGIRQMEESFIQMGTQRMDLMQIHNLVDAATHVKTLQEWKSAGRIRYWGITHYHSGAYAEVEHFIKAERADFLQINYSLADPAITCAIPATRNPKYLVDNMAAGRGRLPDQMTRARMTALLRH